MFNVKHPVVHFRPASHVVADFGCGDCKIALSVKNKVHSFDLAPISDLVTVCDMAHVSVFPHICDSAGRPLPWGLICWIVDARSDVLKTDLAFPPPISRLQVPLKDGSVHIAVFCLSLMGTNLIDFLAEANRVLVVG